MTFTGTYDNFNSEVQAWIGRTDSILTSRFATFMTAAEQRIYYGYGRPPSGGDPGDPLWTEPLRVQLMETPSTISITNGTGTLPSDWLGQRASYINSSQFDQPDFETPQRFLSETLQAQWAQPVTYTLTGTTMYVAGNYTGSISIVYWKQYSALAPSNQSNALSLAFPMVWVEALLIEAFGWTRNDDEAAKHVGRLRAMLDALNARAREAVSGAPSQRVLRIDPLEQPLRTLPYLTGWKT